MISIFYKQNCTIQQRTGKNSDGNSTPSPINKYRTDEKGENEL